MEQINYKSDFDFILRLQDCRGEEIGWPEYDWTARFWTSSKANVYEASRKGDVLTNCFNDGGQIHIVFNNHHLGSGQLHVEFTSELPNDIYPDADERIVVPVDLEIKLVSAAAPCSEGFEVELMLPYVKITWQDLTPEQIAELKQPAVDAANETREAITEAKEATTGAITATQGAVEATDKALQATERAVTAASGAEAINNAVSDAEATRVANEAQRVGAEQIREANEAKRVEAEQVRISDEAKRASSETERITAESVREESERQRVADETERKTAEDDRKEAESARALAEQERETAEDDRKDAESARALAEQERETAERERSETFATYAGEIDQAKRQVFDDLFTSAAGAFGKIDHTHYDEDGTHTPYCLNELWFTYEDMVKIYNRSSLQPYDFGEYRFGVPSSNGEAKNVVLCRTYMPLLIPSYEPGKIFNRLFQNNNKLVTFSYVGGYNASYSTMISGDYAFSGCTSLKRIPRIGRWNGIEAFKNCVSLEDIELDQLLYDVDLHWSPLITLESFQYMVKNRSHLSTKVITVTVHPDVYAKLINENNEDWHAVLLAGLEKNISFATV